ncbi:hypothetical protein BJ166DRAFT_589777 [Pestalotiopsis sp. NC0098]|nr:hypothetical protein BJ166DRAFT_589777 [Pestalotiopsis sp. NC0098]
MLEEVQSDGGPSNGVQASTSQSAAMTAASIPSDVPDSVNEPSESSIPPIEGQSIETDVPATVEGQIIGSQAIEGQVEEETQSSQTIRAEPLADRHNLSWWFPQIDHDEKESWRIWLSRRSRALMLQIGITVLVLVVNFTLTFIAFSRYPSTNGVGLIYSGDCSTVARLDQWIPAPMSMRRINATDGSISGYQVSETLDRFGAGGCAVGCYWLSAPFHFTFYIIQHMQQKAMSGVCEELNITACFDLYDDYWTPQGNGLVFVKNESEVRPKPERFERKGSTRVRRAVYTFPFFNLSAPGWFYILAPYREYVHIC